MGKTIAIASGKGGTGKTMVSANLGATLSRKGYSVILVDMDTGLRNLDLYLGLENNVVFDVGDVLGDVCTIKQAIIKDKVFPGLYFLAASPSADGVNISSTHTKLLYETLEKFFDYVIVDCPAGITDSFKTALGGVKNVVLVVNPEFASLRHCETMISLLEKNEISNYYFIVNKVNVKMMQEGFTPSLEEMDIRLKGKIIGVIREDINIKISTNMGLPVTYIKDSGPALNFDRIADRLIGLI